MCLTVVFKHLFELKTFANQSQISRGVSMRTDYESLYKWTGSHDQDGLHAQNVFFKKNIFNSSFQILKLHMILKLGMQYQGLKN